MKEFLLQYPIVDYILRIVLAVLLGFIVGLERRHRSKEAGIRTHAVVAAGAALFTIVSKYGFSDVADYDASRIASQIVSGVGFLGAGMIMHQRRMIYGLTTAAGVWAMAGVGMAAGAGMWFVAIGATLLILIIQFVFHMDVGFFRVKRQTQLKVAFYYSEGIDTAVAQLFGVSEFTKTNTKRENDKLITYATIRTEAHITDELVYKIISENPNIISIERASDED